MKYLLGIFTGVTLFILLIVSAYFYIDMNDIQITLNQHEDEEVTETKSVETYEQPTEEIQQTEEQPTEENYTRQNNLHDKNKAYTLMQTKRQNLSEEDKKIYDGVIETAKRNINNGVGNEEDYRMLELYEETKKQPNKQQQQ